MTRANTHIVMMRERFDTILIFTTVETKTCQIPFHSIEELFHQQAKAEQLYYNIFIYIFHHVVFLAIVIMIVAHGFGCLF